MAFKKEDVTQLFNIIDDYKGEIKEINSSIKSEIDTFANKYEIEAKRVKKIYKSYCDYMKNKEEFELVDLEVSNIINLLTNETTVVIEEITETKEED